MTPCPMCNGHGGERDPKRKSCRWRPQTFLTVRAARKWNDSVKPNIDHRVKKQCDRWKSILLQYQGNYNLETAHRAIQALLALSTPSTDPCVR